MSREANSNWMRRSHLRSLPTCPKLPQGGSAPAIRLHNLQAATSQVCHKRKAAGPIIPWNLPQVIENNGEPWRARTSDPLIKSAVKSTPAGYGSYDLLTFVTGCSRQRVQLLIPINASLSVF